MFKFYPVRIHQWTLGYYVMVFNATVNNIAVLYRGGQFYWWRKSEYPEKTTDLPQVTDKLYHIILYEYAPPEWDSNSDLSGGRY
jgi:hypothetical protein